MEPTNLADTEATRPTLKSRVVSRIAFVLGVLALLAAMAAAMVREVPGRPMLIQLLVAAPVLWAVACILWFAPVHKQRELVTPQPVAEVEQPAEVVVPAQPAAPRGYDDHGQIVPVELDVEPAALDLTAAGSGPVGFSPADLESLARLDVDAIELTGSLAASAKEDR